MLGIRKKRDEAAFEDIQTRLEMIHLAVLAGNNILSQILKNSAEVKGADLEAKTQLAKFYRYEREVRERDSNTVPDKPTPFDGKF